MCSVRLYPVSLGIFFSCDRVFVLWVTLSGVFVIPRLVNGCGTVVSDIWQASIMLSWIFRMSVQVVGCFLFYLYRLPVSINLFVPCDHNGDLAVDCFVLGAS